MSTPGGSLPLVRSFKRLNRVDSFASTVNPALGGVQMKKILVTGGAGFVGRRFCKRFLDTGHKVHCVDSIVPMTGGIDPSVGWPLYEPRDYKNFQFVYED